MLLFNVENYIHFNILLQLSNNGIVRMYVITDEICATKLFQILTQLEANTGNQREIS